MPTLTRHSRNQVDTQISISPLYPPHLVFIWSQRDNNNLWGDEETETNPKKIITVGLWGSEENLKVMRRMGAALVEPTEPFAGEDKSCVSFLSFISPQSLNQ